MLVEGDALVQRARKKDREANIVHEIGEDKSEVYNGRKSVGKEVRPPLGIH